MTTLKQAVAGSNKVFGVWQTVTKLIRAAQPGWVWAPREQAVAVRPWLSALDLAQASPLFLAGVREDSNVEMDWLWLADRVTSAGERRYCAQRARYINPGSAAASAILTEMQKTVLP